MTKKRGIFVSDHAVLRYLERHYGVDITRTIDEIKAIVEPAIEAVAKSHPRTVWVCRTWASALPNCR